MSLSFTRVTETHGVQVNTATYRLSSFLSGNTVNGRFSPIMRLIRYEDRVLQDPTLKGEILSVYAQCVQWGFLNRTPVPNGLKCLVVCASNDMVQPLVDELTAAFKNLKVGAIPEDATSISDASVDVWVSSRPGRGIYWSIVGLRCIVANAASMPSRLVSLLSHTCNGSLGQLIMLNNSDDQLIEKVIAEDNSSLIGN